MVEIDPHYGQYYRRREYIRYSPGTGIVYKPDRQLENVVAVRLVKLCGKPFFANINATNDTVDWFSDKDAAVHTHQIPHGYYSLASLATALSAGMTEDGGGEVVTCSYNPATDQFIFDINAPNEINLLFGTGVNADRTVASSIGFATVDTGLGDPHRSTLPTTLEMPCVILISQALGGGRKHGTSDENGYHHEICWSVPLAAESPQPIVSYEAKSYESDRLGYQGPRTIGPDIDISFISGPAYGAAGVTATPIETLGSMLIELEFEILDQWK
jgi:hypothetical protein